jgi:hypothetical protein
MKKGLITYNLAHGTLSVKNHIDLIHVADFHRYNEDVATNAVAEN